MTRTHRRSAPRTPAVALALAGVLALAACGGGGTPEPSESPTTTPAASPTATPTETAATPAPGHTTEPTDGATSPPPFPANTEPDTAEASPGAQLLLTDIRLGGHEGFDRVVFEYDGEGTPGWDVRYVAEAIADPSGLPVDVEGGSVLEVTIMGVRYPEEGEADAYAGPATIQVAGTGVITEVLDESIFEGYQQAFIGVDSSEELPFRVYLLEDPTRVVVEVAQPS